MGSGTPVRTDDGQPPGGRLAVWPRISVLRSRLIGLIHGNRRWLRRVAIGGCRGIRLIGRAPPRDRVGRIRHCRLRLGQDSDSRPGPAGSPARRSSDKRPWPGRSGPCLASVTGNMSGEPYSPYWAQATEALQAAKQYKKRNANISHIRLLSLRFAQFVSLVTAIVAGCGHGLRKPTPSRPFRAGATPQSLPPSRPPKLRS